MSDDCRDPAAAALVDEVQGTVAFRLADMLRRFGELLRQAAIIAFVMRCRVIDSGWSSSGKHP